MAVLSAPVRSRDASAGDSERYLRTVEVQSRRKRQVPWVVAGLLLVAGAALGFALWAESQSARTDVLIAAIPIEAGEIVRLAHFETASIALDDRVAFVAASEVQSLVGLSAQTAMAPGAVLHRTNFGSSIPVAAGRVIVGAALVAGEYPLSGLRAGDTVVLHSVADLTGGIAQDSAGSLGQAVIWSVEDVTNVGEVRLFVSLDVSQPQAGPIMDAAAQGRLRLGLAGAT